MQHPRIFSRLWSRFLNAVRPAQPAVERRFYGVEPLEARIAPATLVSYDNITGKITITGDYVDDGSNTPQAGAEELIQIGLSQFDITISDPLHRVTVDVGGGFLVQTNNNTVSINSGFAQKEFAIELGTGSTDSLTLTASLLQSPDSNFTAHSAGSIAIA